MDPRATRTRTLLIDAFNQLLQTKDFEKISIKDITELATVNRATFYAHFVDKYELLDQVLTENIVTTMEAHIGEHETLRPATLEQMFLAIVHLHDNMYAGCRRGYNMFTSMIEEKTKEQLALAALKLEPTLMRERAVMLGWSLYGVYVEWYKTSKLTPEQYAAAVAETLYRVVLAP